MVNNASLYCPITAYRIQKALNTENGRPASLVKIKESLSITEKGIFEYRYSNVEFFSYFMWLAGWNGEVWSTVTYPTLLVSQRLPYTEPFNQAPFFENPLRTERIPVPIDPAKDAIHTIWLPRILDSGITDTHMMKFEPDLPFMSYNEATNEIEFKLNMIGKRNIREYKILIRLRDNRYGETKYE